MTDASQRAALDAVHAARPIVARLNPARDKEDLAADIIEAWAAVETGLTPSRTWRLRPRLRLRRRLL